jgi:fatty-acyl-CoA synthase
VALQGSGVETVTFNLADLFECVADAVASRTALVCGDRRLTYADLDERASRFAHVLQKSGVGPGDHVGLYLYNGTEYLEVMLAAFKVRAVPINVNYRYVADELAGIAADADLVALVCHQELASTVDAVRARLPKLRTVWVVRDPRDQGFELDAADYEDALVAASPVRDFAGRSADDLYVLYTGGTTGAPKGVVWRHEDIYCAAMSGGLPPPEHAGDLAGRARDGGSVAMPVCPLMHASGQWGSLGTLFTGGTVVLSPDRGLRPELILRLIEDENVNGITVVGDAAGRPIADELERNRDQYDLSSLQVIASGGSILSPSLKAKFLELVPHAFVIDSFGASESGAQGLTISSAGEELTQLRFTAGTGTTVVGDDLRPVAPGETGRIARSGNVPLRYYGDEARSQQTFFEADGRRWSLPGDMGRLEHDGTITLLGRGSLCINTGGEKVYPEEVEVVLRSHHDVVDAVVVGVPDERWGEAVAAVVQPAAGATPSLDDLVAHSRGRLAGYKLPRRIELVEEIRRSPAGKADYAWARGIALANPEREMQP